MSHARRCGVAALIADAGKVRAKERLHRLFRLHAQYLFEEFPEYATYVGVRGHNGRWSDHAPAAIARRKVAIESPARALASIDRTKLTAADRLNYDPPSPRSTPICRTFAGTPAIRRSSKAGGSTPRRSATRWGSTLETLIDDWIARRKVGTGSRRP